jgi:hypothetical protein
MLLQQLCKFVNSQLLLPMAAAGTEPAVMIKNGRGATAGGLAGPSSVVTDPEDIGSLPNFKRRSKIRGPLTFVFGREFLPRIAGCPGPTSCVDAFHVIVPRGKYSLQRGCSLYRVLRPAARERELDVDTKPSFLLEKALHNRQLCDVCRVVSAGRHTKCRIAE